MGRAYTDIEREELRIKIKECAKKMFEEEGFKHFRIQKITKEVGISLGDYILFLKIKKHFIKRLLEMRKIEFV